MQEVLSISRATVAAYMKELKKSGLIETANITTNRGNIQAIFVKNFACVIDPQNGDNRKDSEDSSNFEFTPTDMPPVMKNELPETPLNSFSIPVVVQKTDCIDTPHA